MAALLNPGIISSFRKKDTRVKGDSASRPNTFFTRLSG